MFTSMAFVMHDTRSCYVNVVCVRVTVPLQSTAFYSCLVLGILDMPKHRALTLSSNRLDYERSGSTAMSPWKTALFLSFPYVCPEPVLVKC